MATYYLDFEGGNDANSGTSFANRWKTLDSGATAARIAPGDTIRIKASSSPASTGLTATFTKGSGTISLSGSVSQLITDSTSQWTAATNVTTNGSYSPAKSSGAQTFGANTQGSFTTGKICYQTISTLNLSSYQQIGLFFNSFSDLTASQFSIRLCSDTAGNVTVATLPIKITTVSGDMGINSSAWHPLTLDNGSALPSTVNSIAIYADSSSPNINFFMQNISALLAPGSASCVTYDMLIGTPNSYGAGGTDVDPWYAVNYLSGSTLKIDAFATLGSTTYRVYGGASGSATLYKVSPIRMTLPSNSFSTSTSQLTAQNSGSPGSLITFSGGWDRTTMSSQTFATFINCGMAGGIACADYTAWSRFHLVRAYTAFYSPQYSVASDLRFTDCAAVACQSGLVATGRVTGNFLYISYTEVGVNSQDAGAWDISIRDMWGNSAAVGFMSFPCFDKITMTGTLYSNLVSFNVSNGGLKVYNATTSGGGTDLLIPVYNTPTRFYNCTFASSTLYATPTEMGDGSLISYNHNGVAGNHLVLTKTGSISADTTFYRSPPQSLKLAITSLASTTFPMVYSLGKFVANASTLVTVIIYAARSSASLNVGIKISQHKAMGINSDRTVSLSGTQVNVWQPLVITFTPTAQGAFEVFATAYGASANVWYDNPIVTQA